MDKEFKMISTELLQKFLKIKKEDLAKYDPEQLRLILGVFRYVVRSLEREVNERDVKGSCPQLSKTK